MYFVVSPAYGRDYKSGEEAESAWKEGKDFTHESRGILGGGTYISSRDMNSGDVAEIRFDGRRQHVIVKH